MNFEHRYSQTIYASKIAVLGLVPPPFGGVSVHIQRVIDLLRNQGNTVLLFSIEQPLRRTLLIAYWFKLIVWLLWHRPQQVHYHGTYLRSCWGDLLVLSMLRWIGYTITVIEHDCRHLHRRSKWAHALYRFLLRRIEKVIFIGESARESYEAYNMPVQSYSVEGAFLPPALSMMRMIEQSYPSSLFIFLKEHTPIIVMNAAHIMIQDGKDIYGFDIAFAMLAQLKKRYPDVGLVIGLAQIDQKKYATLREQMRSLGIAEHIYILQNHKELWPLYKHADLFIRPTRSDGASISIQEALYFKIPVVASDAVRRPEGVITFQTEDSNHCVAVVTAILQERVYGTHQLNHSVHSQSSR